MTLAGHPRPGRLSKIQRGVLRLGRSTQLLY